MITNTAIASTRSIKLSTSCAYSPIETGVEISDLPLIASTKIRLKLSSPSTDWNLTMPNGFDLAAQAQAAWITQLPGLVKKRGSTGGVTEQSTMDFLLQTARRIQQSIHQANTAQPHIEGSIKILTDCAGEHRADYMKINDNATNNHSHFERQSSSTAEPFFHAKLAPFHITTHKQGASSAVPETLTWKIRLFSTETDKVNQGKAPSANLENLRQELSSDAFHSIARDLLLETVGQGSPQPSANQALIALIKPLLAKNQLDDCRLEVTMVRRDEPSKLVMRIREQIEYKK